MDSVSYLFRYGGVISKQISYTETHQKSNSNYTSKTHPFQIKITSPNLFKTFRYSEDKIKLGKLIFNLVENKYNYKHISNYLNLNGYRTSRGKKFTPILASMFLYKLKKKTNRVFEIRDYSIIEN